MIISHQELLKIAQSGHTGRTHECHVTPLEFGLYFLTNFLKKSFARGKKCKKPFYLRFRGGELASRRCLVSKKTESKNLLQKIMLISWRYSESMTKGTVYSWSSLVKWDEGCIGPSGKLLCLCKPKIQYAAHAGQLSIHVWLLGQSGCSSPSTKELHGGVPL